MLPTYVYTIGDHEVETDFADEIDALMTTAREGGKPDATPEQERIRRYTLHILDAADDLLDGVDSECAVYAGMHLLEAFAAEPEAIKAARESIEHVR